MPGRDGASRDELVTHLRILGDTYGPDVVAHAAAALRPSTDPPAERGRDLPAPLPRKAPEGLRCFTMSRAADQSGVSGTGVVMQGVQFATGRVVVQWLTPFPGGSINVFDALEQLIGIHVTPHPGNGTRITFDDGEVLEA